MKFTVEWMNDKFCVEVGHKMGYDNVLAVSKAIIVALEDAKKIETKSTPNNSKPTPKCGVTVVNLGEITDNETLQMIIENLPPEVFEELMKGAKGS